MGRFTKIRVSKLSPFVAALAVSIVFANTYSSAQEYLIGQQPAANRVIKLRSPLTPSTVAQANSNNQTSRSVRPPQHSSNDSQPFAPDSIDTNQLDLDVLQSIPSSPGAPPQVAEEPVGGLNPAALPAKSVALPKPTIPQIGSFEPSGIATDNRVETSPSLALKTNSNAQPVSITKTAPVISTQIEAPQYINLNQTATIRIRLQNAGAAPTGNVKLMATIPAHAKFARATPMPTHTEGQTYEFQLSNMTPQQVREVVIELIPTEKIPLDIGTEVIVENTQRIAVGVRQPNIKLTLRGPQEANLGQTVNHEVLLENTGDGLASQIQLSAVFPKQLQSNKTSELTIPALEPGQSLVVEMPSLAIIAGQAELNIKVSAIGVEAKNAQAAIRIYQPELEVSAVGPQMNFVNRDGIYTIKLDNTGEVDVSDARIQLTMPTGMQVTTISREGDVDPETGILIWSFDRIPAKSSQTIMLKTLATQPGQQICAISVRSNQTRDKEIKLATSIVTRADLSVVVNNQSGPTEVGGKTQFSVVIENKGSSPATDVLVNIELPESLTLDTQNNSNLGFGNSIHFQQEKIDPGKKKEFLFSTVANQKGEHVVRSILQAAGSERKIITEGSVYVYEVNESRISEALSPAVVR